MVTLGRIVRLHTGVFRRVLLPPVSATWNTSLLSAELRQPWGHLRTALCSTTASPAEIRVQYKHGRPVLALRLPSRGELCRFSVRPMLMTAAHFLSDIQREDPGVVTATILTADGEKLSSTTLMDSVLSKDFLLIINGITYSVQSTARDPVSHEHITGVEDVKTLVHLLHTALSQPEHHVLRQRELLREHDTLTLQLQPLEEVRAQLALRAESQAMRCVWAGLAYLSLQGGVLAWLTWCVFSWDAMEPVTYFITYATSMGMFSYYILTKMDFANTDAKDRQFLHYFYRAAKRERFNILTYNQLRDRLATVENDLRRLRNPMQLQLPVEQLLPGA